MGSAYKMPASCHKKFKLFPNKITEKCAEL
jgi:hypothetical protein